MDELVPAGPDDEAFLSKLYISTRQHEAAALGWGEQEAEALFGMQYEFQKRSYQMQFPGAEHAIVVRDCQRVGRILVWREKGCIRLVDISLLPEYRSQGIGTSLIRSLQGQAQAEGAVLMLSVFIQNTAAFRLYERLGFRVSEQGDMYIQMEWHPPIDS